MSYRYLTGISFAAALFIWLVIPETKGKTLEQIETLWNTHSDKQVKKKSIT